MATGSGKGFIRQLFEGHVDESLVSPWPGIPKEDRESMEIVLDSVRKFAAEAIDPVRLEKEKRIPDEVLDGLRELGAFGAVIPEAHGGLGFSATSYCRFVEELARVDASTATTVGAHQSIGLKALLLFGSDAQKAAWLPKLATGELIAAFALTEPEAGSDAASLRASVAPAPGGDGWVLNGTKQWITNAGFAGFFTVFAKHTDLAGEEHEKISAFIVPRDAPGVTIGPEENKLGLRASSTCQVHFENVPVPAANLLGEKGGGFRIAVEVLNTGRTSLGAGCVGGSKQMIALAAAFAAERRQFGRPIADFELIRAKLARMAAGTYALESAVYLTTNLVDRGVGDFSLEGAAAKVFGTEHLWMVVNEALQVAGGNGFMEEYPYGRYLRDCRINMIFEGTNEILRLYVALTGVKGPGKELAKFGAALKNPVALVPALAGAAVASFRKNDRFTKFHRSFDAEAVALGDAAAALGDATGQLLRKHRKGILERQYQLERLADVAIDLYVSAASLSRATAAVTAGGPSAQRESDLARLAVGDALERIRIRLDALERNRDDLRTAVAAAVSEARRYPVDLW